MPKHDYQILAIASEYRTYTVPAHSVEEAQAIFRDNPRDFYHEVGDDVEDQDFEIIEIFGGED